MLYEGQYDIIELYPAIQGMNQEIAPGLIPQDQSFYIQNIIPTTHGEGHVRYGTNLYSNLSGSLTSLQDRIIEAFPFQNTDGSKQQVLYINGFNPLDLTSFSNLRIVRIPDPNGGFETYSNRIILTTANYALFQPDTLLCLRYTTPQGTSDFSFYEIEKVTSLGGNTIQLDLSLNAFPADLQNYFIQAINPAPVYISPTQFSITVPMDFMASIYYSVGQNLIITVNAVATNLTISALDTTVPGTITFTCAATPVPAFTGLDVVTLSYQSLTPNISFIYNSYGYIKVLDVASGTLLAGDNQTLTNLSVACLPRSEYFAQKRWIYNGVDPVMTWDGDVLQVYKEWVKENAPVLNRVDNTHFTFNPGTTGAPFDITKYQNNNTIHVIVLNGANVTTTVTNVTFIDNLVTITTADNLPDWTGANRVELFYSDKPPAFSYMKGAQDRLWCLGPGAIGLNYRAPNESRSVYFSYTPYSLATAANFRFINENTKVVPKIDISAKHGGADNLEAIAMVHGYLTFIGRQYTQIWQGNDPLTGTNANSLTWVATLPVGIFHGNLIVELANDSYFLSQNGFLSVSTFNIARQFGATTTNNMDKLALEYIKSVTTNRSYRACRAFKYDNSTFVGFKIGQNNVIASRFHTSLYWWTVLSGDFSKATTFLADANDPLYLYIGTSVYTYGDGNGVPISYGDNGGNDLISFTEVWHVNRLKKRFANKRYEIQADYSSNVLINPGNIINLYIRGDLRTSFTLSDGYDLQHRGDVLGTINLANGDLDKGPDADPNYPSNKLLGFRLDAPYQTQKGRLKFVSSIFSVTLAGKTKNGPFSLKKIRLFGFRER